MSRAMSRTTTQRRKRQRSGHLTMSEHSHEPAPGYRQQIIAGTMAALTKTPFPVIATTAVIKGNTVDVRRIVTTYRAHIMAAVPLSAGTDRDQVKDRVRDLLTQRVDALRQLLATEHISLSPAHGGLACQLRNQLFLNTQSVCVRVVKDLQANAGLVIPTELSEPPKDPPKEALMAAIAAVRDTCDTIATLVA